MVPMERANQDDFFDILKSNEIIDYFLMKIESLCLAVSYLERKIIFIKISNKRSKWWKNKVTLFEMEFVVKKHCDSWNTPV